MQPEPSRPAPPGDPADAPSGRAPRQARGEATRQKLLSAALEAFGRQGFDGVSTRELARSAGVNLQAIPYHFGDKEGLYLAAAEHVVGQIRDHAGDLPARIRARLDSEPTLDRVEARALLTELLTVMARLFTGPRADPWAQFMIREQAAPTRAFALIYGEVMQPLLDLAEALLAVLLGQPVGSAVLRLRLMSLIGSILIFRTARAAVVARLGWDGIGAAQSEAILALVPELVAGLERPGQS